MKKILAIAILIIHLFNMGGYLLLQHYQEYLTDKRMNKLISINLYNPNTLIELKVKQNLPGITEWSDFKNVTGQIQLKNACYNYVKLKFTKDTLYVMCVPNYEKTRLVSRNIIYAKQINDIPQDKNGRESSLKKSGTDIKYSHTTTEFVFTAFKNLPSKNNVHFFLAIHNPLIAVQGQPPELVS